MTARPGPRLALLVDLHGRPCLVVGGGRVAERKVRNLLEVGAHVTVVAPDLTPHLSDLAAHGDVRWEQRAFSDPDLAPRAGWRFVVAATDRADLNAAVVAAADRHGIWANDASAADGGPVALPAVRRSGPVTVAVGTGGVHPGAAAWLRDLAAAAILPEHLEALDLVADLAAADPAAGRPDWRAAVDSGMLDLIREGRVAEAKERLQACLSSSSD